MREDVAQDITTQSLLLSGMCVREKKIIKGRENRGKADVGNKGDSCHTTQGSHW